MGILKGEVDPLDLDRQTVPELAKLAEDDDKYIHFHLVCHSHDDVGWNWTPEQYYEERVHLILTNVVKALEEDVTRRFSQTEMYFFERWWV